MHVTPEEVWNMDPVDLVTVIDVLSPQRARRINLLED